jgi:hypothetical protein
MENQNTGSFGAAIGGADPIQEAIARRATGQAGATQQVSPGAATFDPSTAPMAGGAPQGMPQSAPIAGMTPGGQPLPQETPEAQIILNALSTRLKHDSKMKEASLGV